MNTVKQQVVEELHRIARINFRRRRVIIKGLYDLIQADLVEMIPFWKENKGYRYILVVINVFSKFVWTTPVKRKTGDEVAKAMESVLLKSKNIPRNLQTDLGKEFYNRHFENLMLKYNINHYSVFSNKKAAVVERVNRTLKSMMWKKFSLQGSYKWLQLLPEITRKYNNSKHRTTGMKPADVKQKHERKLLDTVYSNIKTVNMKSRKFFPGDHVRISKHREAFTKGYTPNWSNEIFTVKEMKLTDPLTYLLRDSKGRDILGGFYGEELQKVKYPDVYLVEKILKRKQDMILVKWLGLDKSHNSWIHKSNVVV